jgi:hypothetical protein
MLFQFVSVNFLQHICDTIAKNKMHQLTYWLPSKSYTIVRHQSMNYTVYPVLAMRFSLVCLNNLSIGPTLCRPLYKHIVCTKNISYYALSHCSPT